MNGLLIVGFGNTLMGDDGAGVEVIRRLLTRSFNAGVRLVEGVSDSLLLSNYWRGEPRVWLVDAVIRQDPPGTIHHVNHGDLLAVPQRHATVHQLSLPESLRWITHTYEEMSKVCYKLWGIEPDRLTHGEGLSPEVDAACDRVVEQMILEINRLVC